MTSIKLTAKAARTEIARRKLASDDAGRKVYPAAHIMSASRSDLKAAAGIKTRTPKPAAVTPIGFAPAAPAVVAPAVAPVVVLTPAMVHTAARQLAWDYRSSEFKAGRKVTYVAACAKYNTFPAAKA